MLILELMSGHEQLKPYNSDAVDIFNRRILQCKREKVYDETNDSIFYLPSSLATFANVSTLPNILKIYPRPSDWGLHLVWKQWYNSPALGPINFGYGTSSIEIYVSIGCPIAMDGTSTNFRVYCETNGGPLEPLISTYDSQTLTGSIQTLFPISTSIIYVLPSHRLPVEMVMYSTNLNFYGWNRVWLYTLALIGFFPLVFVFYRLYQYFCGSGQKPKANEEDVELRILPEDGSTIPLTESPNYNQFYLMMHALFCGILCLGSAVGAIVGLAYNPALAYIPWVTFTISPIISGLDILLTYRLVNHQSSLQTWSRLMNSLWLITVIFCLVGIASLIVIYIRNSSLGLHVTFYVGYLSVFLARLWIVFSIYRHDP
jgi:hypothetical protein